jgi:shikimate kinase
MNVAKNNLILIGFSGTGKTKIGLLAANMLGWDFVDTDREVALNVRKSVSRIFMEDGEASFRVLEKHIVHQACSQNMQVIASGGGAFLDPDSREIMLKNGLVVCLEASVETIGRRLNNAELYAEPRPLLSGPDRIAKIQALNASRQLLYRQAHQTISTEGLKEHQVAQHLVQLLELEITQ